MTVNEGIKALEALRERGAGEVLLYCYDADGHTDEVTLFEIDAGEAVAVVRVEAG